MFVLHLVFVIMSVHSSLSFPLTCALVVINKSASTNKTKDGIEIIPNVQVDALLNSLSTVDTSTTSGNNAASQQPYTDSNGAGIEMVTLSTTRSSTVTQPESAPPTDRDNQASSGESTMSPSATTVVDESEEKTITSDTTVKEITATDVTVQSKVTADTTEGTTNADATGKENTKSPGGTGKETTTSPGATGKETTTSPGATGKETTTTSDTTVKETTSIPYYDDENIRVMVDPPETSSTERITIPQSTTNEPPMVLDY